MPQPLQSVNSAPASEPVLAVYWDLEERRYVFVDAVKRERPSGAIWFNVSGDQLHTPDGWMPLPIIEKQPWTKN